tara:strand:- start:412 stop:567 length:156 start_codon:yes stop_codon:yes gene_type:complete
MLKDIILYASLELEQELIKKNNSIKNEEKNLFMILNLIVNYLLKYTINHKN